MKYRYISDCHVHSDCSRDADDPTMMMCERASGLGLYALTMTDHCECNEYVTEEYDKSIRQSYFEAKKAKAVFQGRLHVYAGVELGQPTQDVDAAEDALNACDFDFTLASVHNIKGMKDFYFLDYNTVDVYDVLNRYFEEILETIRWGKFDSLAHLTYPLRYIVGEHNVPLNFNLYSQKVDEILKALIKDSKALELNTSGLRQKLGETLPPLSIVKRYHELGGKYVTVGSDAHRWADVGAGIEQGFSLLQQAGFQHFTIYLKHEPKLLPIE
jgi:histidinol-phosphatase (PHP family)